MTIEELSARLDLKQIDLEKRFDRIEQRFDVVEQRLNEADKRFDRIDEKLGELTQSHQSLVHSFLNFRTEVINRFQRIDMRLEMLTGVTTSLDFRLPPFSKALLELGETANRLQQEQVRISKLVEPAA
jgi:predicted  nucleic acid-binding Zn-ribbon protein